MSTLPESSFTHVPPSEGDAYWVVGDLVVFKLGPGQTRGVFSVAETTVPPGGGPPPHLHAREDELFYVLDGDFQFMLGDTLYTGSQGSTVFLPRGVPHKFTNVGTGPGRLLVFAMPCGFDAFIPMAGAKCTDLNAPPPAVGEADIGRLMAACQQFGLQMLFDHKTTKNADLPELNRVLNVVGARVTIKKTAEDTNGQFTVTEVSAPAGWAIPMHRHVEQDECFWVLEGTWEFQVADRIFPAGPGTFVHVPRGVGHSFRNAGETEAKLIDYHSPGGFEAFFEEAGTAEGLPMRDLSPEAFAAICARHGMELG